MRLTVGLIAAALVLTGCSTRPPSEPAADPEPSTAGGRTPGAPSASPRPGRTVSPSPVRQTRPPDPRWLFFVDDRTRYASPWYPGRHRLMIGFGCTSAPFYVTDPRCGGDGFHHGYDVAIPCGTPLRAGRFATVVDNGGLGPAYGDSPVLLRVDGLDGAPRDLVIGHTRQVFVEVGDRVEPGEVFARVSDSGALDGCHLHFEVRLAGGSVSSAVDPRPLLDLSPRRPELG